MQYYVSYKFINNQYQILNIYYSYQNDIIEYRTKNIKKRNYQNIIPDIFTIEGSEQGIFVKELEINPGNFYKNIFRPQKGSAISGSGPHLLGLPLKISTPYKYVETLFDKKIREMSLTQLANMIEKFENIAHSVQPTNKNMKCYGHNIRDLIINACTLLEAEFSQILKLNGYRNSGSFVWKTNDYVKLKDFLYLNEYDIQPSRYLDIPKLSPFSSWQSNNPSQSLTFCDNYNKIKHDNFGNFHLANLENCINAISAYAIILITQYGVIDSWSDIIGGYFEIVKKPNWPAESFYIPPDAGAPWISQKYSF